MIDSNSIKITDLVAKDKYAYFDYYRDGELWYFVNIGEKDRPDVRLELFSFPVPVTDTGNGIFNSQMKSVTMMRWIRKHLEKVQRGEFPLVCKA